MNDCCCGDPNCTDFEDRMKALGIPLDEIEIVEYTIPLTHNDEVKELGRRIATEHKDILDRLGE